MAVTLPAVVEELLSEMAAAVRDGARISDEHLSSLKFVFGSSAIQALDLVDRESVTLISSPSGRRVYQEATVVQFLKHLHSGIPVPKQPSRRTLENMAYYSLNISAQLLTFCELPQLTQPVCVRIGTVVGSSGKTYTCLASCHYCSCPAFAFSVLRKSDSLLCKHLLAIYLSQVMRSCQQLSVSDKQLTDLLLMGKTQEA